MTDTPPPSPEWTAEEPWREDSLAQFEGQTDPLDAQLQEQDKLNRLRFKKATGRIIVWSVYGMWILLAVGLAVWTWQFLTPYPFLGPHQIEKLQSVIFSGSLGAVISVLARNYIRD